MSKWRIVIVGVLFALTSLAAADGKVDYSYINKLTDEIESLSLSGVKMHKKYNLSQIDQLKACAIESKPLRYKAKELANEAREVRSIVYRFNLYLAAQSAFECVYCSDKAASSCNEVFKEIAITREKLSGDSLAKNKVANTN